MLLRALSLPSDRAMNDILLSLQHILRFPFVNKGISYFAIIKRLRFSEKTFLSCCSIKKDKKTFYSPSSYFLLSRDRRRRLFDDPIFE